MFMSSTNSLNIMILRKAALWRSLFCI